MDSTTSTDRGAAGDGQAASDSQAAGVPSASDKPSNGTDNPADREDNDTTTQGQDNGSTSMVEAFLADDDAVKPADDETGGDEEHDDQAGDDRKPQETAQDDKGQDDKGAETPKADEQVQEPKGFARKRIKNLEDEVKAKDAELAKAKKEASEATRPVQVFEDMAVKAGFTKADDLLETMSLTGRALHKREPAAIEEMAKRLGIQPQAPALTPDAEKVLQEAEELGIDVTPLKAAFTQSSSKGNAEAAPAAPADRKPPETPAQDQPPAKPPATIAAEASLKTLGDEIRKEHGEKASEILEEIGREMTRIDQERRDETGHGLRAEKWVEVFKVARDRILARLGEEAQATPPKSLRSRSSAGSEGKRSMTEQFLAD